MKRKKLKMGLVLLLCVLLIWLLSLVTFLLYNDYGVTIGRLLIEENDYMVVDGKTPIILSDQSKKKEEELDDTRLVECSNGVVSISLFIPEEWNYEVIEPTEEGADEFGINFWPKGETVGKIKLMYYDFWGVCGTGLEEVEIRLGEHSAYRGTYDNKEVWDYICYADTSGHFVALNEGADVWLEEHETEVMNILSAVQI